MEEFGEKVAWGRHRNRLEYLTHIASVIGAMRDDMQGHFSISVLTSLFVY
jgi:hypothetical protein